MLGKIKYIIVFRLFSVLSLPTDSEKPQLKIIGGNAVSNRSDFPYQVSLRYMGFHFCGGAIIDYNYIITAAHCCFDGDNNKLKKNYLKVVAGNLSIKQRLKDTTARNVEEVYVHPEYDSESILNDIALWKISSPFIWTEQIQPIGIISRKTNAKSHCYVSGWGVTDYQKKIAKENLQYVELPLVSKKACKRIYPEIDS
ncbi:hypothetical protein WA026_011567 [Henosepilachna vigintioctopunctata]|uniref:Peptidase S1 domain-containing protein n=1 Tax=Henosepilachna vigintioctopunctata TaxID=420089 RepID=A0AAW1TM59_9CUCU